jgi:hypothetical protein
VVRWRATAPPGGAGRSDPDVGAGRSGAGGDHSLALRGHLI